MTMEDMIATANKAGFRVNNLFQVPHGWQANVTNGTTCYEFGRGKTAVEALTAAMAAAKIEASPEIEDILG